MHVHVRVWARMRACARVRACVSAYAPSDTDANYTRTNNGNSDDKSAYTPSDTSTNPTPLHGCCGTACDLIACDGL